MKRKPHHTSAIGLSSLLLAAASAHGSTVLATLSSQDKIIGQRQSNGDLLGYYVDSTPPQVGVSGGTNTRVNQNAVIGFTLPTLNPGESFSAANFAITVASVNTSLAYDVGLFGLLTANPDSSGTVLFSQSATGVSGVSSLISSTFTSTAAATSSIPSSDVSAFLQSFYVGNVPIQSDVFFRLNQTTALGTASTRRMTFTANTAALSLTTLSATLWNNASADGIWNDSSVNWNRDGTDVVFSTGASLLFQDTAGNPESIDVVGTHAPANMTFNNSTTAFDLGGTGTLAGSGSMLLNGGGDVTLANTGGLTFTGTLLLSNSSRVLLATAGTHGLTSIGAGSVLELRNGASVSGAISNSGTILDSSITGTVTLQGAISGSGSLSKTDASTLVLSGDNSYTGATTVNGGKLVVTNSIGNSAVTVSNSGTILATDAAATIGITLAIDNGAILAAGDAGAAGTATVNGATTFNDGSIFSWDISPDGASYDKLISSSLVDGGSAGDSIFRIVAADTSFADPFWTSGTKTWTNIMTSDGSSALADWANIFSVSVVNSSFDTITPVGGSFSLSGTTLTWSAVPEPSSALAGLLLATGLLRRRRNG